MSRLIFANQLRGLAALSVIGSHLVGAFWGMRDFIGLATAAPAQRGNPPPLFDLFSHPYLNFGPLGVGAFFLISGLVIPISLEQHSRITFLLARALRIYPTYVAALLTEMAVLHASATYWGKPFPYGDWAILSNALLIYNTVGQPSIDLVNWTLCVELKFYLLMMLLAPQIKRGSCVALFTVAGILLGGNLLLGWSPVAALITRVDLIETFGTESVFIVFMLIGVLFNFRWRGLLSFPLFFISVGTMLALFLACWRVSTLRVQFPIVSVNYLYDIALFSLMFYYRNRFRPIWVFDFLAAISFPLYLVHSTVGYSVLKLLMMRFSLDYLPALAVALATTLGLAGALHVLIEVKTIAFGRQLSRSARAIDIRNQTASHIPG